MPDVEEQLRRYASGAERLVPAVAPGRAARAPRRRWALVAAAAVAVVAVAVVVALDDDSEPQVSTDPTPSVPTPTEPSTTVSIPEETATTAPATRTLRTFPVVAVSPSEYLVWSGEAGDDETSARADGFAIDLVSGAVRPIPVAPIAPRSGATGVWTGEELVVCCGATGDDTRSAAAWNPGSGAWRVLSRPPESIAGSYAASVWTGEVMVVVAPGTGAATYDPEEDTWQEIAAPAVNGRVPEAAWTGEEVIVWDSAYGSGIYPAEEEADRGHRWSPGDDAWTPLPPLPPGSRTRMGSMAWTGTEVVVWGQSTGDDTLGVGARWRPGDDSWRPIASWPHNPVEDPYVGTPGSQTLAATGDGRVLVTGLEGSSAVHTDLYDPQSDTWLDLGFTLDGYHPSVTIAGDRVLIPDEDRPIGPRLPG